MVAHPTFRQHTINKKRGVREILLIGINWWWNNTSEGQEITGETWHLWEF
jgi:hypothetical protein